MLSETLGAFFEGSGAVVGDEIIIGGGTIGGRIVGGMLRVGVGKGVPISTDGIFARDFEGVGVDEGLEGELCSTLGIEGRGVCEMVAEGELGDGNVTA